MIAQSKDFDEWYGLPIFENYIQQGMI